MAIAMMMLIIATLSRKCGKQVNQLVTLIPFCFLRQPSKPNVPRRALIARRLISTVERRAYIKHCMAPADNYAVELPFIEPR
jgi:hypothetical protein